MLAAGIYMWIFTSALCPAVLAGERAADAVIKQWIESLGDPSFDVRSEAEAKLANASTEAMALVLEALKSSDPEIKVRATRVLGILEWNEGATKEAGWLAAQGPIFGAKAPGSKNDAKPAFEGIDDPRVPAKPGDDELSINAALEWLSRNQEADGHWDSRKFGAQTNADIEQTAIALLAFSSFGHTEKLGMYKDNLQRGCDWLCKQQQEDGSICRPGEIDGLTHAIASMSLAELFGMNQDSKSKEYAQKALNYSTQQHQSIKNNETWGFGRARRSQSADLLTTTFFVMQLKSAKVAGLKVDQVAFDGVIRFLNSMEGRDKSSFRFAEDQLPSPKATAMGLLCRSFLGFTREDLEPAATRVLETAKRNVASDDGDVVLNYFACLALYQHGGSRWNGASGMWKEFYPLSRLKIDEQQRREGPARGSFDPEGPWSHSGRIFSTVMKLMCCSFR